ncbi:hypothetical protein F1188_15925 [Roseospira marina]|uniref:Uncharacterized protein n=1 Tax=Roseospira marina TaxID=140057 RepID=A0A5M6I9G5_9PROT|nr:hypothetical protein [Roseospira marina]KAA5604349.1 hypothetical protein F1188_15925 [Roseospira marina]MBB4315467.1 hypothetical protein [Roseospira marina]MBB5088387.1 hypothetical protein [Roseospira marina]
MMVDSSLRPGCYGSVVAFDARAPECASCPFAEACGPLSAKHRKVLYERLGIADLPGVGAKRPKRKVEEPSGSRALMPALPRKVQAIVDRIAEKGVDVGGELRAGRNPFSRNSLKIAAHLLMRLDGGFDRDTLRTCLQTKLDWSEKTARAHVTQTFHLMPALGVAEVRNGRLVRTFDK